MSDYVPTEKEEMVEKPRLNGWKVTFPKFKLPFGSLQSKRGDDGQLRVKPLTPFASYALARVKCEQGESPPNDHGFAAVLRHAVRTQILKEIRTFVTSDTMFRNGAHLNILVVDPGPGEVEFYVRNVKFYKEGEDGKFVHVHGLRRKLWPRDAARGMRLMEPGPKALGTCHFVIVNDCLYYYTPDELYQLIHPYCISIPEDESPAKRLTRPTQILGHMKDHAVGRFGLIQDTYRCHHQGEEVVVKEGYAVIDDGISHYHSSVGGSSYQNPTGEVWLTHTYIPLKEVEDCAVEVHVHRSHGSTKLLTLAFTPLHGGEDPEKAIPILYRLPANALVYDGTLCGDRFKSVLSAAQLVDPHDVESVKFFFKSVYHAVSLSLPSTLPPECLVKFTVSTCNKAADMLDLSELKLPKTVVLREVVENYTREALREDGMPMVVATPAAIISAAPRRDSRFNTAFTWVRASISLVREVGAGVKSVFRGNPAACAELSLLAAVFRGGQKLEFWAAAVRWFLNKLNLRHIAWDFLHWLRNVNYAKDIIEVAVAIILAAVSAVVEELLKRLSPVRTINLLVATAIGWVEVLSILLFDEDASKAEILLAGVLHSTLHCLLAVIPLAPAIMLHFITDVVIIIADGTWVIDFLERTLEIDGPSPVYTADLLEEDELPPNVEITDASGLPVPVEVARDMVPPRLRKETERLSMAGEYASKVFTKPTGGTWGMIQVANTRLSQDPPPEPTPEIAAFCDMVSNLFWNQYEEEGVACPLTFDQVRQQIEAKKGWNNAWKQFRLEELDVFGVTFDSGRQSVFVKIDELLKTKVWTDSDLALVKRWAKSRPIFSMKSGGVAHFCWQIPYKEFLDRSVSGTIIVGGVELSFDIAYMVKPTVEELSKIGRLITACDIVVRFHGDDIVIFLPGGKAIAVDLASCDLSCRGQHHDYFDERVKRAFRHPMVDLLVDTARKELVATQRLEDREFKKAGLKCRRKPKVESTLTGWADTAVQAAHCWRRIIPNWFDHLETAFHGGAGKMEDIERAFVPALMAAGFKLGYKLEFETSVAHGPTPNPLLRTEEATFLAGSFVDKGSHYVWAPLKTIKSFILPSGGLSANADWETKVREWITILKQDQVAILPWVHELESYRPDSVRARNILERWMAYRITQKDWSLEYEDDENYEYERISWAQWQRQIEILNLKVGRSAIPDLYRALQRFPCDLSRDVIDALFTARFGAPPEVSDEPLA